MYVPFEDSNMNYKSPYATADWWLLAGNGWCAFRPAI